MKYLIPVIIIVMLIALILSGCPPKLEWVFVEESILVKAEFVKAKGSGYLNDHWWFTFENGMKVRNFDTGCAIGKVYKIYYKEAQRKYKTVLKTEK